MPDRLRRLRVETFTTPLKRPFVTALGRKTETVNVGVWAELSGGARGYGEASASIALAHLRPRRLSAAVSALGKRFLGAELSCPGAIVSEAWKRRPKDAPAVSAFECALLSALAASKGLSLWAWLGGARRALETDITLSAVDAAATALAAREAHREGFRVLKVKVGTGAREDLARVRAARRAAPGAIIRLDGNQGLTMRTALALVETCLIEGPVELLEQPLPKGEESKLPALVKRCPVPVVADESVATPEQAARLAEAGAAGGFNVKLAKSGISRGLEIAAVARAAGLKLMVGCMTETARGLSPSVALALGTGLFDFVDLDSDHLLAGGPPPIGWRRRGRTIELVD